MSSHKGPAVAQGSGAPASSRVAGTVELAELDPMLEGEGQAGGHQPNQSKSSLVSLS